MTLSRLHLVSQSINRAQCPYVSCNYKTDQKSNLKAHINARQFVAFRFLVSFLFIHSHSSTILHYRCRECNKGFTDPAGRIRHRKKFHGYQPYHTPAYLAKRALKEAEKHRDKAALNKTHDQQAATIVPDGTQNASSSTDSLGNSLADATYHNDFWKLLVDSPHRDASELKVSQDVQIFAPVAVAPARETPKFLHSDYFDLSLPKVDQHPSTIAQIRDEERLLGPQLDTTVQPQSQALAHSWTAYGQTVPVVATDHSSFATTFPASDWQSTYPDMSFQSLPEFSFTNVPLSMPNSFDFPATPTAPSSSCISGNQFVSPDYMTTLPPIEPVPTLSWTPSLSLPDSLPLSQTENFTDEVTRGFNTWYNLA